MHLASRQSISDFMMSNLFWIEKLIKFVSSNIRKGGPRAVLYLNFTNRNYPYLKNIADGICSTCRTSASCFAFAASSAFFLFSVIRLSFVDRTFALTAKRRVLVFLVIARLNSERKGRFKLNETPLFLSLFHRWHEWVVRARWMHLIVVLDCFRMRGWCP